MNTAWTPAKTAAFRAQFERFLEHVSIQSKELGTIRLGEHLYMAQTRLMDGIFDGLSEDIHDFKVGKSRQLGITTFSRALTLFWAGVHPGLRGYFVTYDGKALEEARIELRQMAESLPSWLGFPKFSANRDRWVMENDTVIMFASAGTKRSSSTGTLGRGSGINFVHASEVSSWASGEQYESFRKGLATDFPDRFYLWESTARGFNLWHDIWGNAIEDTTRQKTIFLGWWTKDNQRIEKSDPAFKKYGETLPTHREMERIHAVKEMYGYLVLPEQLAWYRREMDPTASAISGESGAVEEDPLQIQEVPWTEDEMFQATGATFFSSDRLTFQEKEHAKPPESVWQYEFGVEFPDTRVMRAQNPRTLQLKVWEEPADKDAVYVVSADPAGGSNEKGDRSCVQVNRAYADGLDQAAEFASRMVGTQHFAWVIASLLGYYLANGNDVYFILEINGTGEAVLKELRSLKKLIEQGYLRDAAAEAGIQHIFRNVKNFMWTRADALHPSNSTWHWKTTSANKKGLMERFRDYTHSGLLHMRSHALLEEMRTVRMDGDSVGASAGKNDDRVVAQALGVRCWEDRCRARLGNRTRRAEDAKKAVSMTDMTQLFMEHQLGTFFAAKRDARRVAAVTQARRNWRGR